MCCLSMFFFFNDPATTEIYPLSLHDALPILIHIGEHQVEHRLAQIGGFIMVAFKPSQYQNSMQQDHIESPVRRIRDAEGKVEDRLACLFDQGGVNLPGGFVKVLGPEKIEQFHGLVYKP